MKRRFFIILPMLASVGLLFGGCSSTGPSLTRYDANKPQTFLGGAEVEQAKSLAMGSAVTKGWKIVDSSGDRLVVTRPISAAAAQSVAGESVSTASLEVKSEFYKRQDGVDVVVDATMIADAGSKAQRKIDFTDSYKDDLNRSLNSLQRAWNENRWRVASATPPLPTKEADQGGDSTESSPPVSDASQTADSGPAYGAEQSAQTAAVAPAASAATGAAAVAASTAASSGAAPVEDRYAPATPPPAPATTPARPSENMMTLNRQGEQGVWTYYAEHYAKIRGCVLSNTGAVLQEKQPEYEVHRVYCEDEKTFLVRCNAGTCRGLE